jgi:hypothetical protein
VAEQNRVFGRLGYLVKRVVLRRPAAFDTHFSAATISCRSSRSAT